MDDYLSSGRVAELLGVPTHRLDYLTRDRQVRPIKGPTGAFVWTYQNVTRAAKLLELSPSTREQFHAFAVEYSPSVQPDSGDLGHWNECDER